MKHFSREGVCLFGKHKGAHASRLPKPWIDWACQNVNGFKSSLAVALATNPPPPPRTRVPSGRIYILNPKKRYEPKGFSPPPGSGPDPSDAFDWEDDPGMGQYFEQA